MRGAVPVAMPSARGRPASVIRATSQRPAAIASAAWATCTTYDEPAGLGGVDVPQAQAHVVGHGEAAQAGRVARAEVAVHVVLGEARVGERAVRDLGVELGERDAVRLAGRMLEDADDVGLVPDAHDFAAASASGFSTLIGLPAP